MQDMMHCLNDSVLERQRSGHLQWQQQQISIENLLGEGWPNLTTTHQYPIDTVEEVTTTTTTTAAAATITTTSSAQVGKERSSKKRKADKSPMVGSDDEEKRMMGDSSMENSEKKPDYIHVRARRGQATDSHSLAERVRRERISERMKYLQGLVPGCSKITGKAGMLDEIINYVQSLQRQVEFLSMKLAAVNPRMDFNMESLFTKEMNLQCNSNTSMVGMTPPEVVEPTFLRFHSLQQAMASCGFDMLTAVNPAELAVRRTISAPLSTPATASELFLNSFINVQRTNVGWDNDFHGLYSSAFPFQSLQGNVLSNLKSDM